MITFKAYAIMEKLYDRKISISPAFYFFLLLEEIFHSHLQLSAKFINSGVLYLSHIMKFYFFIVAFLLLIRRFDFHVRHFPFT
jgi:hypothetical protein